MANPLKGLLRRDPPKDLVLGPYVILEVTDPVDHCDVLRHRYGVYASEGHIQPEAAPTGEFRDVFDSVAVQLLARDEEGVAVGSSRIVLPSGLGLPTQRLFNLGPLLIDPSKLGEVGRLCVSRTHRGGSRTVLVGLIAQIYNGLRARGLTHFLAFMRPELVRGLRAIRVPIRPLSHAEPGPEALEARRAMAGYFSCGDVLATLCSLDEMDQRIESGARAPFDSRLPSVRPTTV